MHQPQDARSLWWLGEPAAPRLIGVLHLASGGRSVAMRYDASWLATGFALSEDLPLTNLLFVPAEKDTAAGAVDDARPDRWGEKVIRLLERSPRLSILEYLLFAGDDRYGALGVSQRLDAYVPWPASPLPVLESLDEMAAVVRKVLRNEPVPESQRRLIRPGMSMGGAQPKSVLSIAGEPWLVKFSDGGALDLPLIEHAALTLAARCGIDVTQSRALPLAGSGHAIAVRRFDRASGRRLHALSAHVALRAAGEPMGYPQLAALLRRLAPADRIADQQAELFRRMVFNLLMDNTDDHEKNHALLRDATGRYLLSPAFDIAPTGQGLAYQAMLVGQEGTVASLGNALSSAGAFGLRPAQARAIIQAVAVIVQDWQRHFRDCGVTPQDIALLAQAIDGPSLGAQREAALAGRVD